MNIENIVKQFESRTLEFKEQLDSGTKIIQTIIAFANTSGGQIVIGVNDKTHYIVGVLEPHKIGETITNLIHDRIEPRILPNIEILPYRNTHLVVIEIYPSVSRPHFEKSKGKNNGTYIRIGSTTRLADNELIQVIARSAITKSFDEEPCQGTSYEDIDFTAASQLFKPHRTLLRSNLVTLGLVVPDIVSDTPTIGGILLFSSKRLNYFPDSYIQIGTFDGIDKTKILNSQSITSFLPNLAVDALEFIKHNIKVGLKIDDIHHIETWEIPKIALREAIINAIVHTDYSLNGAPIRISLFKDRIEIENSALLPWGLTLDDLKMGVSKLRNPVIGRVFYEVGLIERWGSGIQRMIAACEENGLQSPKFEEIGPRIRVTFFKNRVKKSKVDPVDQEILLCLEKYGPMQAQDFVSHILLSKRTIIHRLAKLVVRGVIFEIAQSPTDPKKKYSLR